MAEREIGIIQIARAVDVTDAFAKAEAAEQRETMTLAFVDADVDAVEVVVQLRSVVPKRVEFAFERLLSLVPRYSVQAGVPVGTVDHIGVADRMYRCRRPQHLRDIDDRQRLLA
jgi:hypothetical protein